MGRRREEEGYEYISTELLNDPDFLACKLAEAQGEFDDLPPGTWVAFQHGKFLGSAAGPQELAQAIADKRDPSIEAMFHQVHLELPVARLRSPRIR